MECIRDGARAVEQGRLDFIDGDVEGTSILKEQHEASFAAACTACRALRDLSALSKDFAAVVTDDILRVNTQWSTCVVEGAGYDCSSGGLISDLLILLKHANEVEAFYQTPNGGKRANIRANFNLSTRRQRRGKPSLWPCICILCPVSSWFIILLSRCSPKMRPLCRAVVVGDVNCKRPGGDKFEIYVRSN